jgi:hypothetical protein
VLIQECPVQFWCCCPCTSSAISLPVSLFDLLALRSPR